MTGGKSAAFASCRQVVHRLTGKIEAEGVASDKSTLFVVAAHALPAQTVEEWKAALAAPATPVAEAAPVAKPAPAAEPVAEDPPAAEPAVEMMGE